MPSWMRLLFSGTVLSLIAMAADPVVIRNLDKPGKFEVENTGPDISLRSRVEVQKHRGGVWAAVASDVRLEEACSAEAPGQCRVLKTGGKIQPLAYDGFTCNSKCPPGCKGNAYLGPGEFRIVIHSCDGQRRFLGPAFGLGSLGKH